MDKKEMMSKQSNNKTPVYFAIYELLKRTTNLQVIQDQLKISKQHLNNNLRKLKQLGLIRTISKGCYEVIDSSKHPTKYGNNLPKDYSRGHAYVWNVKLPKEIKDWNKRLDILKSKQINFKLVGALRDTPRIKALGRKVWLCKDHIRIFDKKDMSYYGKNAIESRRIAFMTLLDIVRVLENKLGFIFKPFNFDWNKEHYALIKNDLAIDQNKKGIIWRINDEEGEWLLIDDSMEEGGELETVGKGSFNNNIKLQKWWNENKETNFEVTPKFVLNSINQVTQNQMMFAKNIESHIQAIQDISKSNLELQNTIKELRDEIKRLNNGK